ncbi:MAG TPA: ABC transporter permease, partial [Anaerolineae bacterium]
MQFSFQRLAALIRKELIEILRDRRFIILVLAMTLVQLFVYSYAAGRAVYHLPLAVVDQSRDRESRGFVQALVNSQYFDVTLDLPDQTAARQAIDRGQVKAALILPPRFSAATARGSADVLFLLDGADSFAVRSGYAAATVVTQAYAAQLAR